MYIPQNLIKNNRILISKKDRYKKKIVEIIAIKIAAQLISSMNILSP